MSIAAFVGLIHGSLAADLALAQTDVPLAPLGGGAPHAGKMVHNTAAATKRKNAAEVTPAPSPGTPSATGQVPAANAVSAQLREHNAGACAARVDALGSASMPGVSDFRAAAMWNPAKPNAHAVGAMIGQRYPDGNSVPFGATIVFGAPLVKDCDAMSAQVLPSPQPCSDLAKLILAHGKMLGDLDGVQLLQDGNGQTLLVPGAANTCVLVGLKAVFVK